MLLYPKLYAWKCFTPFKSHGNNENEMRVPFLVENKTLVFRITEKFVDIIRKKMFFNIICPEIQMFFTLSSIVVCIIKTFKYLGSKYLFFLLCLEIVPFLVGNGGNNETTIK